MDMKPERSAGQQDDRLQIKIPRPEGGVRPTFHLNAKGCGEIVTDSKCCTGETVFCLECLSNTGKTKLEEHEQKSYSVSQITEALIFVENISMHCVDYVSERSGRCVSQGIRQTPQSNKSGSENEYERCALKVGRLPNSPYPHFTLYSSVLTRKNERLQT
jgi:hypothetical protein